MQFIYFFDIFSIKYFPFRLFISILKLIVLFLKIWVPSNQKLFCLTWKSKLCSKWLKLENSRFPVDATFAGNCSSSLTKAVKPWGNDQEIEIGGFHEIKSFLYIKYWIIVKEIKKGLGALGGHYFRIFSLTLPNLTPCLI